MIKKILALFGLSVLTLSANAALITTDLNLPGDGLVMRDTTTGLDWLSQSACAGVTGLCTNSTGFLRANRYQVRDLLQSAGIFNLGGIYPYAENYSGVRMLFSTGFLAPCDLVNDSLCNARIETPFDYGAFYGQSTFVFYLDNVGHTAIVQENTRMSPCYECSGPGWGNVALVRASTVPIPAAAWLFGTALLGLVGVKRRHR